MPSQPDEEWLDEYRENATLVLSRVSREIKTVVDIPWRLDSTYIPVNETLSDGVIAGLASIALALDLKVLDSSRLRFQKHLHQSPHESHRWWRNLLKVLDLSGRRGGGRSEPRGASAERGASARKGRGAAAPKGRKKRPPETRRRN